MTNPTLISTPFAADGDKSIINDNGGEAPNSATWEKGFPVITQTPITAGGIPPKRTDFNGVLNAISENIVHQTKGLGYEFDAAYAAKIGGYPLNARLTLTNGDIVLNTVAGNTTDPNVDMTGWIKVNDASQIFDESGKSQQTINKARLITVKDYGAKGNGVTDDTEAFNLALGSSSSVFIPEGVYLVDQIQIGKNNQELWGTRNSVVMGTVRSKPAILLRNSTNATGAITRCVLRGFTLDGGDVGSAGILGENVSHLVVEGMRIRRTRENALAVGESWCTNVINNEIANNWGNGIATVGYNNNALNILGNRIFANDGIGLAIHGSQPLNIIGNTIEANKVSGLIVTTSQPVTIQGNYFEKNSETGITLDSELIQSDIIVNGNSNWNLNTMASAYPCNSGYIIQNKFAAGSPERQHVTLISANQFKIEGNATLNAVVDHFIVAYQTAGKTTQANLIVGENRLPNVANVLTIRDLPSGVYSRNIWNCDVVNTDKRNYFPSNLLEHRSFGTQPPGSSVTRSDTTIYNQETIKITGAAEYGIQLDLNGTHKHLAGKFIAFSADCSVDNPSDSVVVLRVRGIAGSTSKSNNNGVFKRNLVALLPTSGTANIAYTLSTTSGSGVGYIANIQLVELGAGLLRETKGLIRERLGTSAPTAGYWYAGDRVYNASPVIGSPQGWVCIQGGSSAIWASLGGLS